MFLVVSIVLAIKHHGFESKVTRPYNRYISMHCKTIWTKDFAKSALLKLGSRDRKGNFFLEENCVKTV